MSRQSRRMSFGEVCFSTGVGFAVNFVLQLLLYPRFDFHPGLGGNVLISLIFTAASVMRGWCVRRLFNWWDHRGP